MLTNESFLLYLIITVVSFMILWAIVSIPVWISARVLNAEQGKFSRAMLVTGSQVGDENLSSPSCRELSQIMELICYQSYHLSELQRTACYLR